MKAVRLQGHGGGEQLRYGETEEPQLARSGDVIVKLRAAALNHNDLLIRRGETKANVALPRILGCDGAGVVVAVGNGVNSPRVGDAVCIYPRLACGRCEGCVSGEESMCARMRTLGQEENGTYAEYIRVPAKNCAAIPAGLSFEEAAALPSAFADAWRMLITNAALKPGESVLISGMGGDAATAALQLAMRMGARTIAAADSDEQLTKALNHGAAHGINYAKEDLATAVRSFTNKRGVDVAVANLGGGYWAKNLAALAKGGRLVSCGVTTGAAAPTDLRRIFWNHLKIFGAAAGTRSEFLRAVNFMTLSQTKPIIDRSFSLRDAAQAHRHLETGEPFGKIVLRMDD